MIDRFAPKTYDEALDFAFIFVERACFDVPPYESEEEILGTIFRRLELKFDQKSTELVNEAIDSWRESHMCDIKNNYGSAFDKGFREICRSDEFKQAIKDSENGALDVLFFEKLETSHHYSDDVFRFEVQLGKDFMFLWKNEVVKTCKATGIQKELENLLDKVFKKSFDELFYDFELENKE